MDTFWPKILGEYGIFGLIAFCYPLILAARSKKTPDFSKYMFWALLVISLGTPVYNYSDAAVFGGLAIGLMLATGKNKKTLTYTPSIDVRDSRFQRTNFEGNNAY
jgi:UDP-N-acetylmuramyl pentapeptide phosphotransferase/UDP-N-acetylglucosamine-1-phosphate transferase